MPIQVQVGPPIITINQGRLFMVTKMDASIEAVSELGAFAYDTRFLSTYSFSINYRPWTLLTSQSPVHYAAEYAFQNPALRTEDGAIGVGEVGMTLTRSISDVVHEDFDLANYSNRPVRFFFGIRVESDFADIFDVRQHQLLRRHVIRTEWDDDRCELQNTYVRQDFFRRLRYRVVESDSEVHYSNGQIVFEVRMNPGEFWHACGVMTFDHIDTCEDLPLGPCRVVSDAQSETERSRRGWERRTTQIESSNTDVVRTYAQAIDDLAALRLHDEDLPDGHWVPAAGLPWFMTIFGRDSLLVSYQTMLSRPEFAMGSLQKLASYQATHRDDWRDAQPGKIPHEVRFGELSYFRLIPHTPYYGTADATILYLIVLHEAWKWIGDGALLKRHLGTAQRCLEWIDEFGDLDGDGFQEYLTYSSQGYENMAWKDAHDSVVYPDGSPVLQPKALCELQGYVYDAWVRMAEVYDALDERALSEALRSRAAELKRRFNEVFWSKGSDCIAFALDGAKKPVETVSSNAGHCLWSGIVDQEYAGPVVRRLLAPDMWTGWGVRTLSAQNPAYNPHSYQRGSVWPHDNAVIAAGMKRYGFANEANHVAKGIFDAARAFSSYRLPELFAGLDRGPAEFPVQYLGANVPQAWAAGSIFMLLRTMLGLRADAPNQTLYVEPSLPDWLPDLTLTGLQVGKARLDIRFRRDGATTAFEVLRTDGPVRVLTGPFWLV